MMTINDLVVRGFSCGICGDGVSYPNKVLREGMTDPSIAVMQRYLNKISEVYKNIPSVNSTGYFGPKTLESVVAIQKEFDLTAAGIVGAVTWDKIAEVYSDIVFGYDKSRLTCFLSGFIFHFEQIEALFSLSFLSLRCRLSAFRHNNRTFCKPGATL